MPLPFILGGAAAVAGLAGVGTAIHGAKKMKDANDTMQSTNRRHEKGMERLERQNQLTTKDMDDLGVLELEILRSFSKFSDVFEQIKNRPNFEMYSRNGVVLPKYEGEKIKDVSIGAGVLLGGLGGAGLGAAGGFAAAGATTAAVMAIGSASTGTAIASLSGAAATNATLAALGGGAIAAGGGGMALGASVLGATTLGAGLLVGGIIFNFVGGKIADQANEARKQMIKAEDTINIICRYLADLRAVSIKYYETLSRTNCIYQKHLNELKYMVTDLKHTNWNTFTSEEKRVTENTVLLVGLLYNMCKVEIVLKGKSEDEINTINKPEVEKAINNANTIIADKRDEANGNEKEYWIVEDDTVCEEYGLPKDEIPVELLDYIGYKEYVELDDYVVWSDYNGAISSSYEYHNKSVRFFENKNTLKMDARDQYKIYNKKTNEYSSFSSYSVSSGIDIGKPCHNKMIYRYLHGIYEYDVDLHKSNCIYENLSSICKEFSVNDNKVAFIDASDKIIVLDLNNNKIIFEKKITTSVLLKSYDVCLWNGKLFYEENRKIMKYDFDTKTSILVYEYHVPEKEFFLADIERFMYIQKMVCSKEGLYIIYWDKNAWKIQILKITSDDKVTYINCDIMSNAGSHICFFEENKNATNKVFLLMYVEGKMYVLDMISDKVATLDVAVPEKTDRDRFNLVDNTLYWGEDKNEPSYKVDLMKKWKTVELNPLCI